jgi:solute carrier family 36 (proton-coupled amino acid transporter)
LPITFGTAVFALEGIGLVLPIEQAMKERHKFKRTFGASVSTVLFLFCIFGSLGYIFYGDQTQSVITKNLSESTLSDSVKLSLCLALFLTYAVQMFPVTSVMDEVVASRLGELPDGAVIEDPELVLSKRFYIVGSLMRIGFVVFTCVLAAVFTNFGLIVSLVGALSNSAISFILPMLFYLRICVPKHASLKRRIIPYILIVFGVVSSIVGLYFTIRDMIKGTSD